MDESLQTYKFWAFISYSHYDKKHARRLAQRLAGLRVPAAHRSKVDGAPARFAPVFIDEDENAAHSRLSEEIEAALRKSRKLVVICSPFAANSAYVAEEIRYFKQLGRQADILCLVVAGVPNASDEGKAYLECFPPPLRFDDCENRVAIPPADRPLAATIGEGGDSEWQNALDQTVAGMLDITLGDLKRSQSGARLKRYAGFGALSLLAGGAAWFAAWALVLPHTTYAKNFLRRSGVWEEVDRISAAEASNRAQSYLFRRRGAYGRPLEVHSVNRQGACQPGYLRSITDDEFAFKCTNADACAARFSYSPQGVATEEVIDQYGHPIETVSYQASPALPSGHDAGSETYGVVTSAVVGCSRKPGAIDFVRIGRFKGGALDGLDRRILFFSSAGRRPQPNANYVYGLELDYDNRGRLKEKTFLSETGRPMVGKPRYGVQRFDYTDSGDIASISFHYPDRSPAAGAHGIARITTRASRGGDVKEDRYFGVDGRPAFNGEGLYGKRFVYRRDRNSVRTEYLGSAYGSSADRNGVASIVHVFDEAGYIISRSTYGVDGKAVPDGAGCFRTSYANGTLGAVREKRCLDMAGKPMLSFNGIHATRHVYDRKGNQLRTSFWLTDNSPAYCTDSLGLDNGCPIHRCDSTFDENGNRTSVRFYDEFGAPMVNGEMRAGFDSSYSANNFHMRTVWIGLDGRPTYDPKQGHAGYENTYNLFGQVVTETSLDKAGRPVHSVSAKYDPYGNVIRMEFRDLEGKPRRKADGIAGYTQEFDGRGRITRRMFFGPDGKPERQGNLEYGYAEELDPIGRPVRRTALGPDGAPAMRPDGHASLSIDHSHPGIQHVRYFDAQGQAVALGSGAAARELRMSPRDDVLEQRNFGLSGDPVAIAPGGYFGYSALYDARWKLAELVTRDAAWMPIGDAADGGIAITRKAYDRRGRLIRETYFDKDGKPMSSEGKSFARSFDYDRWGRVSVQRLFAQDGKTLDAAADFARVVSSYDDRGRTAEKRYYDAQGNPTEAKQAASVRHAYDDLDRLTGRRFFDKSGQPIPAPLSGRAEVRFLYNVYGQQTEEQSLGLHGEPVNRKDTGWYRRVSSYDGQGRKQPDRCYTVAGAIVAKCGE